MSLLSCYCSHRHGLFKLLNGLRDLLVLIVCVSASVAAANEAPVRHHSEHVLGTSLDIEIYLPQSQVNEAQVAIKEVLGEIARLEATLSSYRSDSELSGVNKKRAAELSPVLSEILGWCEHWLTRSNGKFSCRLGQIRNVWLEAEKLQQVPSRVAVRKRARKVMKTEFEITGGQVRLPDGIDLDINGLAKGYIIDAALAFLMQALPTSSGIRVDIGGDARYVGRPVDRQHWQVGVANPNLAHDNDGMIATLALGNAAIASSGHRNRYFEIDRRQFSHILDPRDGWPLFDAPSAIVVAQDATTADAVATALSTQEIAAGIEWVESLANVEALMVSPHGLTVASSGWSAYISSESSVPASGFELVLDYQIPRFDVSQYNRPYLAIWVSDADNRVLKNLLLLGESERWATENRRWWRASGRKNPGLLNGVARPTRRPGKYSVLWDGSSDSGEYHARGAYILHVEAAREHGGHDYKKIELSLSDEKFKRKIDSDREAEIGAMTLHYSPLSADSSVSSGHVD